jgi:hypothetical protein
VLLGAGFVVVGCVLLLRAGAQGGLRVEVHEKGLIWQRGGRSVAMRWDEIETVRHESIPRRLLVTDRGGWCFAFDPTLARFEDLIKLIEVSTLPHLLEVARETLEAREVCEFAAAGVSPEGLTCAGEFLPWSDLAGVEVEPARGWLCVLSRTSSLDRPFARLEMERVVNLHVLLALVQEKQSLTSE